MARKKKAKDIVKISKVDSNAVKVPAPPKVPGQDEVTKAKEQEPEDIGKEDTEMAKAKKAKEVEVKVTDENGEEMAAEVIEAKEVMGVSDKEARKLVKDAKKLREKLEAGYYQLAEKLYEIREVKAYRVEGYDRFEDWIEMELSFQATKARTLIRIVAWAREYLPESAIDTLRKVGWTKADEIVRIAKLREGEIEEDEINELIALPYRKLHELREEIKREEEAGMAELVERMEDSEGENQRTSAGEGAGEDTEGAGEGAGEKDWGRVIEGKVTTKKAKDSFKVVFEMDADSAATYKVAIKKAKEVLGTDSDLAALQGILTFFVAHHGGDMNGVLATLEVATGVRMIAVKGDEVIYGGDFLEEIIEMADGEGEEEEGADYDL